MFYINGKLLRSFSFYCSYFLVILLQELTIVRPLLGGSSDLSHSSSIKRSTFYPSEKQLSPLLVSSENKTSETVLANTLEYVTGVWSVLDRDKHELPRRSVLTIGTYLLDVLEIKYV